MKTTAGGLGHLGFAEGTTILAPLGFGPKYTAVVIRLFHNLLHSCDIPAVQVSDL